MQYFTALGFDTGYTMERALSRVDAISRSGLEYPYNKAKAKGRRLAYVAKSPAYGRNLYADLSSGDLVVKHAIVPVRDLAAAAESRRHVTRQALASGKTEADKQKGGVVGGVKADKEQERLLAVQFHTFIHTMLTFDVPIHFLKFPDFAKGDQDLYAALGTIMTEHGVTREESDAAFELVLRPDFINDFKPES